MAITIDDFNKIWASTSPLTPYTFSESNYKEGWNFVGSTPPSRQMWDGWLKMTDEKCQYLYNHEDVPVGHEYFTFNPNIPQGSLPLFGGEYSRETYSALWNWVQEQTGYLKTEAEWQTLATANNGNVPYYSDGDGSTTFRVPALNCWMRSANGTVSEVGSYLQAGLPNITGSMFSFVTGGANDNQGALYQTTDSSATTTGNNIGSAYTWRRVNLDASRSNSIYGNSSTVQPASVVGLWLVKAYGTVADTGVINEQQYIDDRIATEVTRADGKYLPLAGGTMTGNITLPNGTAIAEDDIFYKAGDTFNFDDFAPATGFITSGRKEMYASIVLPKRLDNINSITCNSIRGGIRIPTGGYVHPDNTDLKSLYTVGVGKLFGGTVRIQFSSTNEITSAVNNTPLAFVFNSMSLTFN